MQHTVAAIGVARILLAVSGALLLLYHVRTLAMSWNVDDERCEVIIKGYGPQPILFTEKNWSSLVQTYSRNESYELRRIREILHLKPGMRLCDVGAGDGTEVAKVGISVMPDGHLHSTGSACAEVHAQLAATRKVDPGATAAIGTPSNAGLAPASCDAMMARMSYHMMYASLHMLLGHAAHLPYTPCHHVSGTTTTRRGTWSTCANSARPLHRAVPSCSWTIMLTTPLSSHAPERFTMG